MEVLAPDTVLILWSVFSILSLVLFVIALVTLLKKSYPDSTTKLIWAMVIIFVPTIGSILFLTIGRKK